MAFWIQRGLSIKLKYVRLATLKELLSVSSWNMLIQLSGFLVIHANPLVIGRYIGVQEVPYYRIPLMLVIKLQTIVTGMSTTLIPIASSTLASGDVGLMRNLLSKGSRAASMILFPLGGVLLVMCKDLFRVWLPAGYEKSWVIYAILMIAFFGIISQSSILPVLLGGGRIRGLAITYISSSIACVILSVLLVGYTNLGILGAAVAIAITKSFDNIIKPWYGARQLGLDLRQFILGSYAGPILCSLPSVGLGALLVHYFPPRYLVTWALEFIIALVPYAVFALTGILDWPLRRQIVAKLFGLLRCKT
jgi:O-antigen/teichoic acid export membrane protein